MPKGYNALSDIEINHAEIGICPEHGYLLTSDQCNCHPEMKALFYVAEQLNFRDKHTFQIDKDLKELDAHPVEEAYQAEKQYKCEVCASGVISKETERYPASIESLPITCPCCYGNWQDCETCYRLSQLPKNVTASKTWLERNTHGSPEEREQARKNGEMLKSIRSGI